MRLTIATLFVLVIISFCPAQGDKRNDEITNNEISKELLDEFEQKLKKELEDYENKLELRYHRELNEHRMYLQTIDDRLYNRIMNIVPIITAILTISLGVLAWLVGKTKKEAYDYAKMRADLQIKKYMAPENIVKQVKEQAESTIQKIEELSTEASEKVKELQNKIAREFADHSNKLQKSMNIVKTKLVKEITNDLESEKDNIIKDKKKMIQQSIDEAIKSNFNTEFNIMDRLEKLENEIQTFSKRFSSLEDDIREEAIKQAISPRNYSIEDRLSPLTQKLVDSISKIIKGFSKKE